MAAPKPAHGRAFDESKPVWKAMLIFLVPLMLSNILQSASGTFNSIFLGRMIGVDALAAASSVFPIIFFLISFLIGLITASTVLIGQAYGAGDLHRLKAVAGTALFSSFLLGLVVAAAGGIFTEHVLRLLATPENILPQSVAYSRVIFFALPLFFVYVTYSGILRGTGDSQTPFYFLILSTVLGIGITPMLIRGWLGLPHLGVISAAVSFIGSNAIGLVALAVHLSRRNHPLALDGEMLADLRIDWPIFKTLFRLGVPTGFQLVMVSLSEIAVLSFVNRFGSNATAAYGAVNQIVGYVQFPAISIGIATSIFGAQAIGAQKFERVNRVIRAGVGLNYAIGALLIGLCYIFSAAILAWFITDQATLQVAHRLLMITLWGYLIFGNSAVLSGLMRASGAVVWPTVIGVSAI